MGPFSDVSEGLLNISKKAEQYGDKLLQEILLHLNMCYVTQNMDELERLKCELAKDSKIGQIIFEKKIQGRLQ